NMISYQGLVRTFPKVRAFIDFMVEKRVKLEN
ncbi:hypothetical protein, partial [Escherichia coli]